MHMMCRNIYIVCRYINVYFMCQNESVFIETRPGTQRHRVLNEGYELNDPKYGVVTELPV